MTRNSWIIFCFADIFGLLLANLGINAGYGWNWQHLTLVSAGITVLALAIAIVTSRLNRSRSQYKLWLGAGIVAILAVVYFQLRVPQPGVNDVSNYAKEKNSQVVTVAGKVLTEPRLTASQKLKFWLKTEQVDDLASASGKLYVTVPLLSGTGIYPGKHLQVRGVLYLPTEAKNPGSFDFKAYLARQGAFAGLQGFEVVFDREGWQGNLAISNRGVDNDQEPVWGWWKLRRRIIRSHLQGLGSPVGQLVSSMVLGRRAVDLSADIRDRFIEAGLAHILAASGFHVSLLLGIILKLTKNLAAKLQLTIGLGTLFTYIGLTGLQPSVLRAGLMGTAVLIAIAMDTKVKPLGSLLLAATILLLFNPLWIGDVGFQLSFLATLGLIVTLPALQKRLDWLPPAIATLIAVPIAASVWVLPLLSYVFNTVATYSIPINIICTPLIVLISLGGMISAIAALIIPSVGSAIALVLFYPASILIQIVTVFTNLPGSSVAIGKIPLGALLVIYGLFCLVWRNQWFQSRWRLVLLFAIAVIIIPIVYSRLNLVRVDVLAAKQEQVIVIQDQGKVILINSGKDSTAKYIVLPFLAAQGINYIDYGVELDSKSSFTTAWSEINNNVPIKYFVSNLATPSLQDTQTTLIQSVDREIFTNTAKISLDSQYSRLKLEIKGQTWLIVGNSALNTQNIQEYIQQHDLDSQVSVLLWSSNKAIAKWLKILQPQVAIAVSNKLDKNILSQLLQKNIDFYNLQQDGAISWTSEDGFRNVLDTNQRDY